MFLKNFRGVNNSKRNLIFLFKKFFFKKFLKKNFSFFLKKSTGRCLKNGMVCKKNKKIKKFLYHYINYFDDGFFNIGYIYNIYYNRFKNSLFCLIKYYDGSLKYFPLIQGFFIGDIFISYPIFKKIKQLKSKNLGLSFFLKNCKKNYIFSNIIINRNKKKPTYIKSSGTFGCFSIFNKSDNVFIIFMPSGFKKLISENAIVILGRNYNLNIKNLNLSKAGKKRMLFKKQKVCGFNMNSVDHPNGGKAKKKIPVKSPWGWIAKKGK